MDSMPDMSNPLYVLGGRGGRGVTVPEVADIRGEALFGACEIGVLDPFDGCDAMGAALGDGALLRCMKKKVPPPTAQRRRSRRTTIPAWDDFFFGAAVASGLLVGD